MKAVVIYDTKYGNTEQVAKDIARLLGADIYKVTGVKVSKLDNYNTFIFGSPTHKWNMSSGMKELFKKMSGGDFTGKKAAVFDTKFKGRFAGSAAKKIENDLKRLGFTVAMHYVSFYVTGMEGPLAEGEIEKSKTFVALK